MSSKPKALGAPAELENISPKRRAVLNALNDGVPLLILSMELLFSMRLFSIGENEALVLNSGSLPFRTILAQFRYGWSSQGAPSLYALWVHVWLLLSDGALTLLRVPSALFFLAGVWLLSRAARFWGGEEGGQTANALLWLAASWPYAFHYGSQVTGYSFAFFLIAALVLAYLRFCDSPSLASWAVVCSLGLLLIYLSYFGWALLIFLGADYRLRNRHRSAGPRLIGTAALFVIAYAPLWPTMLRELWGVAHLHPSGRILLLNAGYNFYVLLASESVAPWFWRFGLPVTLAIATALLLCWFSLRGEIRRFLVFGGLLILGMDLAGILQADRLLLVAPWFLVPIAVALCTTKNVYLRRSVVVALLVAAGIGWYGAYVRRYYATGRFAEPWSSLAAETAGAVQQDAGLISNSQSIFLYLTYDLAKPQSASTSGFSGFLPETVRNPQVWSADSWKAAGRPIRPYMIWMDADASPGSQQMVEAAGSLDPQCGGRVARYLVRDPAYDWKKRFFAQLNASPWRIEIRQYLCEGNATSQAAPSAPRPAH